MGIIISFSGIDGAGKSTQVKLLSDYLIRNNKKVITTEEMFGYYLLKPIIFGLRKATGSPPSGPVKRNKNSFLKLWFLPAFVDIWFSYIFKYYRLRAKYDYIIADRYYTDIWANLLYYGYSPKWAFRYLASLLPRSDIPVIFTIRPINVRKREDDFPLSYYQEQSLIYKNLSKLVACTIVDANNKQDSVHRQIRQFLCLRNCG